MTDDSPGCGFDLTPILTPEMREGQKLFAQKVQEVARTVREAQEKLLREWVDAGLPLERADPRFELSKLDENMRITVRVWIDWRELPGDVTVEGETSRPHPK